MVNRQSQSQQSMMTSARWRQLGLTWQWWRQQKTSGMWSAWGAWFNHARALVGAWGRVKSSMRLILLQWCRSEKEDFDDDDGELIRAILMACEARGKVAESLTGAWMVRRWWFRRLCVGWLKSYPVICLMS